MPSIGTARSVVNRFIGLGLQSGRRVLHGTLNTASRAMSEHKEKKNLERASKAPATSKMANEGVKRIPNRSAVHEGEGKGASRFAAHKQAQTEAMASTLHATASPSKKLAGAAKTGKQNKLKKETAPIREKFNQDVATSRAGFNKLTSGIKKQAAGAKQKQWKEAASIAKKKYGAVKSIQDYIDMLRKSKKPKLGSGKRFAKIEGKAAKEYGSEEAGKRVAASIMWKKYGKKKGAKLAHHKKSNFGIVEFSKSRAYLQNQGIVGFAKSMREEEENLCKDCGEKNCSCEKSLFGIVEFFKSGHKVRALKAGRKLEARLSSHTYRQTAPAVKRSAKAKLRPKKAASRPKGAGIKGVKKSQRKHNGIDYDGRMRYQADTQYDRALTENENDKMHDYSEDMEMNYPAFEPERARGYYRRKKKPGRHTPNVRQHKDL